MTATEPLPTYQVILMAAPYPFILNPIPFTLSVHPEQR